MGGENQRYLMHHGVQGMKWGVRRYQNPDGSLTDAGKKHQAKLAKVEAKLEKKMSKAATKGEKYSKKARKHAAKGMTRDIWDPRGDVSRLKSDKYIHKYQRQAKKYNKASAKLAKLRGETNAKAMPTSGLALLNPTGYAALEEYRRNMRHSDIDILTEADKRLLKELSDPELEGYVKTLSEEEQDIFYNLVDEFLDDDGGINADYVSTPSAESDEDGADISDDADGVESNGEGE